MTNDLIDLALLTGARGGELVGLTGRMIDRSQEVWVAVLADHKMSHKGKTRALVFGPRAIEILKRNWPSDESNYWPAICRVSSGVRGGTPATGAIVPRTRIR